MKVNRRGFLKGVGGAGIMAWALKPLKLFGFKAGDRSIAAKIDTTLQQGFTPESNFPHGMYGESSTGPPGETWNELIDDV